MQGTFSLQGKTLPQQKARAMVLSSSEVFFSGWKRQDLCWVVNYLDSFPLPSLPPWALIKFLNGTSGYLTCPLMKDLPGHLYLVRPFFLSGSISWTHLFAWEIQAAKNDVGGSIIFRIHLPHPLFHFPFFPFWDINHSTLKFCKPLPHLIFSLIYCLATIWSFFLNSSLYEKAVGAFVN